MKIEISTPRRDGKYAIVLIYEGAANAFGGFYPGKVFRKVYDLEKIKSIVKQHGTEFQKAKFK